MPKCLEKYYKEGWEVMGTFADTYILGWSTRRVLYDPKKDEIIHEFSIGSLNKKKMKKIIEEVFNETSVSETDKAL